MTSKKKTISAISLALVFGMIATLIASASPDFSVEVPDRYGYARADLNDGAVVEYIGDYNVSYGSSGSGVFDPFVRLQGNEKKTAFQSGYNTDAKKPEFDTKTGTWTHAILLSEIPIIEFEGTLFWEFWADINDSDSTPLISLDDFELYLTDDPELLGYPFDPLDAELIYDFDVANAGEFILINDVNQGSGRGDLRYLVPADDSLAENCNYGNLLCTTYIVLYSEWGGKGDPYQFDGGFEEWKVKIYPKLQVSKTIEGSYDRTVTWDLKKYVNTEGTKLAEYEGEAGDQFTPSWLLFVDKTEVLGNYAISGTITIIGDEDTAVDVTLTDKFDGVDVTITGCSVEANLDDTYTIAAGATVTCDYELALGDEPVEGTNIARATFEVDNVKLAFEGSAAIYSDDFKDNLIGVDSGTLTDDRVPAFSETVSGDANFSLPETFTCSTDINDYTNGSYTVTYDNEGKLVVDTTLTDTASVTITCVLHVEYETAYAYDPNTAQCFSVFGESRWGWVNGPILPGVYTWPVYAGAGTCVPDDGTYVGDVTVTYDGETLDVVWEFGDLIIFDSVHIYAGVNPPDNFAPGQYTITIPEGGGPIYVVVHFVVGIPQIP